MKRLKIFSTLIAALLLFACSDDDTTMPLADFQFLVDGSEVIFNGTVENATTVAWSFGDGNTAIDIEDPIHAYAAAGTYQVELTVTDEKNSFTEIKEVTILPSLEILLTGGKARPEGKSWKLRSIYTSGKEGAGFVEDALGIFLPSQDNLLYGMGLGNSYEDTFTFVHDGSYKVNNKDGQSLFSLIYAMIEHGADITAVSADPESVPLAHVLYTPKTDATWTYVEGDFTVDAATGPVQFKDKTQLIMDEYFGFKDKTAVVILKEIDENFMNVAIGIATEPSVYNQPTLLFHLSFEAN